MNKITKNLRIKKVLPLFLVFALIFLAGCQGPKDQAPATEDLVNFPKDQVGAESVSDSNEIDEDQAYYDFEDLAAYVHLYKKLPKNYITKEQAKERGWSVKDNQGLVIGGDEFYNREGLLPKKSSRTYYEADLMAGYGEDRGPERLVFSDDGLIFYTEDHYKSFEQLY